jgi:large subunit ribosomal protein L35
MTKIKMKTHKAGAKRLKATGTGKIVRAKAGRGHLNAKKSSARKRRLEGYVEVYPGYKEKLELQIPYINYLK